MECLCFITSASLVPFMRRLGGGFSSSRNSSQPQNYSEELSPLQPTFTPLSAAIFPDGRSIGNKIFKTSGSEKSFADAQEVCRQAGGQLASPRSFAENTAIQQLITAYNKAAFLSMTDVRKEGTFVYPTEESLVYSNWAPGEPNNNGGSENCVEIFTNGQWNDKSCGEKRLVVCEF